MSRHHKCLICESTRLKQMANYYEKHGLIKCQSCGLVFMERIPSPSELNSHYAQYAYKSDAYLSPLTVDSYNLLLDEFEHYRMSNQILDVGCGRGFFLQEAKKRGWQVHGTEYSETAVQICSQEGLDVKQGKLDPSIFDRTDFDIITSFEVLEHINNPNEELQNINSLLRKGGLFFCTTPNFNSLLRFYLKADYDVINYPEHLTYYTKGTLNKVLKQNGFKKKKLLSTGISITRVKTSKKTSKEKLISKDSSDERLREIISRKWYLVFAKKIINQLLTFTQLGITLKGFYVKR